MLLASNKECNFKVLMSVARTISFEISNSMVNRLAECLFAQVTSFMLGYIDSKHNTVVETPKAIYSTT